MAKVEKEVSKTLLMFFVSVISIASILGIADFLSQERKDIQLMISYMTASLEYALMLFVYASFKILSYSPIFEERKSLLIYHKILSFFILFVCILFSLSVPMTIMGMIINYIAVNTLLYLIDPILNWKSLIFVFPFLISYHYDYIFYVVISYVFLLQEIFYLVESKKLRICWFISLYSSIPAVFFSYYYIAFLLTAISIILLARGIYNVIPSKRKRRFMIISSFVNLLLSMIFCFEDINYYVSYFNVSYFTSMAIIIGMIFLDLGRRGHLIRRGNPEKLIIFFMVLLLLNTLFGIYKILKNDILWQTILLLLSMSGFCYSIFIARFFGIA